MYHQQHWNSPVGELVLISNDEALVGCYIKDQRYFNHALLARCEESSTPAIEAAIAWLKVYFEGSDPGELPPIHFEGTEFRRIIWNLLTEIPYGKTTTYGELSRKASQILGLKTMSAQAVGGAVGHNPISIIVPCHRVLGSDGSLTGYAGGLDVKEKLLKLEGAILI